MGKRLLKLATNSVAGFFIAREVSMTLRFPIGEKTVLVDDDYSSLMTEHNWYVSTCGRRVVGTINGNQVALHRHLIGAKDGQVVDHINGDQFDNRMQNLRICTHAQNMRNRKMHSNNQCKVKGVYFDDRPGRTKPFVAGIRVDGKKIYLGSYHLLSDAEDAYKKASKKYHGEFSRG